MVFDIHQLDKLSYEEVEPLLEDYIETIIEQYVKSLEGEEYLERYEEVGGWIGTFIEMAYIYEVYTLPRMKRVDVQFVMEKILPRKLTLLDPKEAENAVPELISFWQFLKREYNFRHASAIIKYLEGLGNKFVELVNDPQTGGFLKALLLEGHQEGFDMTTPEGLQAFQDQHNAKENLKKEPEAEKNQQKSDKSQNVSQAIESKYEEIVEITDKFAQKHLNEEYAQMIRSATAALSTKSPSPLEKGKANTWACGLTHAIGMVNFLFDKSQTPHISASDLYKEFGVSQSTGQGQSKKVRDLLEMSQLDPKWTLPSRMETVQALGDSSLPSE